MPLAEGVLELARWAPSGDNSQPWRFRIASESEIDVYGYDTRDHCVYDLDGWSSQLAHGMLLETVAIAASAHGAHAHFALPDEGPEQPDASGDNARPLRYRVRLELDSSLKPDPLAGFIVERSVQRRPMVPRSLTPGERDSIERAARPLRVAWFDSLRARARIAALCMKNARIRMTIPEAYSVHRSVIAWRAHSSEDRLPDRSLGADPALLAMMRYAMASWQRLERVNRWMGTLLPRLELDFLPGVLCSAHIAIVTERETTSVADRVAAGRAIQRVWLTATSLGMQMQPEHTPLVFARYARTRRTFTRSPAALNEAAAIATGLEAALPGVGDGHVAWLARIGPARRLSGRSLRLPLDRLIVGEPPAKLPPLAPA